MAEKATIGGKACVVQEPREREMRQTNFGTSWNEVRIGFIGDVIGTTSDDCLAVNETITYASYLDLLCFGLINNVTSIPGQAGTNFVGYKGNDPTNGGTMQVQANTASATGAMGQVGPSNSWETFASMSGTTNLSLGYNNAATIFKFPAYTSGQLSGALFGLRFVVVNKGLSNQTITLSFSTSPTLIAITPATADTVLRSQLINATWNALNAGVTSLAWNSGGSALTLPDTWYLRLPFLNNRIRIGVKGGILIS